MKQIKVFRAFILSKLFPILIGSITLQAITDESYAATGAQSQFNNPWPAENFLRRFKRHCTWCTTPTNSQTDSPGTLKCTETTVNACTQQNCTCEGTETTAWTLISVTYVDGGNSEVVDQQTGSDGAQVILNCDHSGKWEYYGKEVQASLGCRVSDNNTATTTTTQTTTTTTEEPCEDDDITTPSSTAPPSTTPTQRPSTSSPSTTTKKACPSGGEWGDWGAASACTDSCGGCGTSTKTRQCKSESYGCSCEGASTQTSSCNATPCAYPRNSCCGTAKVKGQNGKIVCI